MNHKSHYLAVREYARHMRRNPTPAETRFWEAVRNRRFRNFKFYRQYIKEYVHNQIHVQYFILDFYCHSPKLAVEIDGSIHRDLTIPDEERTRMLNQIGIRVIRFTNAQVLNEGIGWRRS